MRQLRHFEDARAVLAEFVPPAGSMAGNYTLERMQRLMAALGNPQETYHVVHVAGTSGKSSTAYFVAALLCAAGKNVGLTISPHVDEVNERVQINLVPLVEADYCRELGEFLLLVQSTGLRPTYFELLVAFAYWKFARQGVDYAVVEVGLGGLLDATNVVERPDKLCVLTDIGYDHMDILGHHLSDIAAQKAGIVHTGNPVVCYRQSDVVMGVFRDTARRKGADLHEITLPDAFPVHDSLPSVQQRNWYLAYRTYELIRLRGNLEQLSNAALLASQQITIPARMEAVQHGGKTIMFDGAHNGQKMAAAVSAVREKAAGQEVAVLVGMLEDKQAHLEAAMQEIATIASAVIVTGFAASQDLPRRPLEPAVIAKVCREQGCTDVVIHSELSEAVGALVARPSPLLFVTGSFYMMHEVRSLLAQTKVSEN